MKQCLPLLVLSILLAGCRTTLTNLTPRQEIRNPNGLYPVEVMWSSTQETIPKDSIKGYTIVGLESYPMKQTPMLPNRWETLLPVPPDKQVINYRFKFDYEYRSMPQRRSGSILSTPYQLEIIGEPK